MPTAEELKAELIRRELISREQKAVATQAFIDQTGIAPAEHPVKKVPGFMDNVALIESATAKGMLEYTGSVASAFERLLRGGGKPTTVPEAYKYWEDKVNTLDETYDYAPWVKGLAGAGKLGSEMLTTAPAGGLLGKVVSKSMSLGAGEAIVPSLGKMAVPVGLRTAAKYGTSAGGSAGVLAGMEAFRFDPENPDQFNTEAASAALNNPLSYAIPAVLTKAVTYGQRAQQLGKQNEVINRGVSRDTLPQGATRTLSQMIFDPIASLTDMGKRARQIEHVGEDVSNFISKWSNTAKNMNSEDLINLAGKQVQGALNVVKLKTKLAWEKPFKDKIVDGAQDIKDEVINVLDIIKSKKKAIPNAGFAEDTLNDAIRASKFTVDNIKNIQAEIGKVIKEINEKGGGLGQKTIEKLNVVQDNLFNKIQGSLSGKELEDFISAKQQSRSFFNLKAQSPLIKQALVDETKAKELIRTLISSPRPSDKMGDAFDVMSNEGQKIAIAAKLKQIMEKSQDQATGKFNPGLFVNATKEDPQLMKLMKPNAYKSLEGFDEYLKAIHQANKTGWWRPAAILAGSGLAAGVGGYTEGLPGAGAVLASLATVNFAANHSPLKYLFYGMTKNLPQSTKDHIVSTIQNRLTQAGYFLSKDGILQHKSENK